MRRFLACTALGLVAVTHACRDAGGPEPVAASPGIRFLKGAEASDTIGSVRSELLQISVGDADGHAVSRATVVVTSLVRADSLLGISPVSVGRASDTTFSSFYHDSTGSDGTLSVHVKMGGLAGKGGLIVHVPSLRLTDTAQFTVLPGKAAHLTVSPSDTTMAVGKTLTLRARVTDRRGNTRTDTPTYRVVGTGVAGAVPGQLSATQPARVSVIATVAGMTTIEDTTFVSAVPDLTIAVRSGNTLATLQLDGSNYREIPTTFLVVEPGPRWAPNGESLLATVKTLFNDIAYTAIVSLGGTYSPLLPPPFVMTGFGGATSYQYSAEGKWIYFTTGSALFRTSGLGATPERLCTPTALLPPGCMSSSINSLSVSSDGTLVAFEHWIPPLPTHNIRLFEVVSRTERILNVPGRQPRWSPVADVIAFWSADRIWVMNSSGTNIRSITPVGRVYVPGVSWTRDGQWLVARYQPRQDSSLLTTVLLNVASGLELPISTLQHSYSLPDFKPIP